MQCPRCNAENREGAKFCVGCGASLAPVCPQCGTELPLHARFCDECGAQVGVPPAGPSETVAQRLQRLVPREFAQRLLATRGQVAGERRIVTMLFSDVKGSTPMAERLDPEDVLEIMDGAFDVLIEPITRYEGALARLMGDGILAFFGAPVAHEDDAERACRAALEILEGAGKYAARLEEERGIAGFNVRVGIHTGLVVVGEVGSDLRVEYTAMGDAVNLASRMEEAAEPGTVLITEDTHRLIARLFETKALGPVEVRGRGEPVSVFRVVASRADVGKPRGIEGLESPLVGRDGEVGALREVLGRLQAGVGGIVTIVGEAGIGKSRLVAELRKEAVPLGVTWVEGRCLSYGESMAYLPWVDMLHGLLGMAADASPFVLRDALREWVLTLCPESFDEVYPHLGHMMSLPPEDEVEDRLRGLDAEALKFLAFRAVERIVESAARERPLVLVCEDVHWADPTSLELLEQLLGLTDQVPLLLVCALRPYREHACWGIREAAIRLYHHRHIALWLEPLSAAESQALVGNLLRVEALPRALRERILDHAEGNPFYVEEVIRSLIDSEAIVQDEATGHWQAAREVDDIEVPDTLQGVLMARIDWLEEEARRALQMASVIGRIFLYRVLMAIAGEEKQLDQHLRTLQREEMIRERARVPEVEYIFKHHLTQEAAYNGLLRRERRLFHRRVAEALERLFPDRTVEQLGVLARHWERAEEPRKAIDYLRRAGEQAAAQFANAEALGYFSRALELSPEEDLAGRYDLLMARQGVYGSQGALKARWQELEAAQELAENLDDARCTEVALWQARCAVLLADYRSGVSAARRAIGLAQAIGDQGSEAAGLAEWGYALRLQGDIDGSLSKLRQALTIARAAHLQLVEALCLRGLGSGFLDLDDRASARVYLEQSIRIYHELGDRRLENEARVFLGWAALGQSRFDEARVCYEQALRVFREIGDRWNEGFAQLLPSCVYHVLGNYDRARAHYDQYLRNCREMSDRRGVAIALCMLGLLCHQMGDDKTALRYAEQALQIARDHGEPGYQGAFLTCLGHALLGLARTNEADEVYREALILLRELHQHRWAIDVLAGLARVCLAKGDLAQAQGHVEEILSYLEDHTLGTVYVLGEPMRVYLTCYRILQASGDPRSQVILETAHRLLQERAAKISDERERRSFLENVAANREVVSEYVRRQREAMVGQEH